MASKIVVIGDVNGRISELFTKLSTLHAKQSFAFAIIAGNLFSPAASTSEAEHTEISTLLNGAIDVPLPTYFALGTNSLPTAVLDKLQSSDGELCANLSLLGRRVSIKTSNGFRIISLGGSHVEGSDSSMSEYDATYSDADATALVRELPDTDILVTSDWPAGIRDGSKASYTSEAPGGIRSVSDLCTALKPRYHFSTSAAFYEREPFFHPGPRPQSITRFISLAPFGNAEKQKWIYAFSLEPSAAAPPTIPQGCTASPLTSAKKRKLEPQQTAYNSFRYSNGDTNAQWEPDRNRRKRQKHQPPPTPDQCFFCLSNANCETHMIGSIGEDCYVTIAKGPLTTRSTFPDLGFTGHVLLIPLHHSATLSSIPDQDARQSTVKEMQRYRTAMHDMIATRSKGDDGTAKLGAVTWEISRGGGVHVHWQFLPVSVDLIQKGLVEAAFDVEAENLSYPKFAKKSADVAAAEEGDYFKVMIWSEAIRKEMVLLLDREFRFDLQFGRKVMAKLLGLESRTDWRACAQDKTEEEADVAVFKEAFKQFDFSLEE
ncbi:CwfJ C-terminus 2-domain-containing protein-like protein [Neohortaea acidophila]|uniref:CwfJ C-terminus 2-domain-containing protein-like protein n=1 Tax=Neohortaea acidophila TaxID=245834 RepID=A0A6A6Q4V6_9PEZI|nr:CwfJ C-terminus 2-domain-containing protein-like protein [Neohortaea acidophila]KAF2487332.1 CwfJ C-terminus 2-domain-containing protein-like protein [Neohortaea acidophila]